MDIEKLKELGIQEVSFDIFMNELLYSFQDTVTACYENDSDDLLPVFSVQKISNEQFNLFLAENPDFHNDEESERFTFNALNIKNPSDVYFYLVVTGDSRELYYLNH